MCRKKNRRKIHTFEILLDFLYTFRLDISINKSHNLFYKLWDFDIIPHSEFRIPNLLLRIDYKPFSLGFGHKERFLLGFMVFFIIDRDLNIDIAAAFRLFTRNKFG